MDTPLWVWLPRRIEGIRTWLQRSGSGPIQLSISMGSVPRVPSPYEDEGEEPEMDVALCLRDFGNLLCQYAHRLKYLSCNYLNPSILKAFHASLPAELPLLETMEVRHPSYFRSLNDDITQLAAMQRASSLRVLRLKTNSLLNALGLPVHWENLTELSLSPLSGNHIGELAKATPFLRKCSLEVRTSTNFQILSPPAEWPCLASLEIAFPLDPADHGMHANPFEAQSVFE
ncbi:hypothetical protein V5O48_010347 [Marasmius crinis-equi]|uniref:Uncharacterized protein n=1 Tax=Marasmius crinis-equi TaxID=585013 RepID=A0ABR3F8K1_9AGAR